MDISIRVYYEDTDCGGVVYYANYLKYFERGRTEYLMALGVDIAALAEGGTVFVVSEASASYHAPARYGDLITLSTRLKGLTGATIAFEHEAKAGGKKLATGLVTLAATGPGGRPKRIPDEVKAALSKPPRG